MNLIYVVMVTLRLDEDESMVYPCGAFSTRELAQNQIKQLYENPEVIEAGSYAIWVDAPLLDL